MSIHVLKNARVSIDGNDLSNHVESVTIKNMVDLVEASVMGDAGKRRLAALADCSAEITFRQDYDASEVEAVLFPLLGSEVAVAIRPVNDTISSTNPEYQFNGMFAELPVVAGSVGQVHNTSVTIVNSDGAILVRDTTP